MNLIHMASNATTAAYIHTIQTFRSVVLSKPVRTFMRNEKAVTAVEYAIVMAGVAGVVAVIFNSDTGKVKTMLEGIFTSVETKVKTLVN